MSALSTPPPELDDPTCSYADRSCKQDRRRSLRNAGLDSSISTSFFRPRDTPQPSDQPTSHSTALMYSSLRINIDNVSTSSSLLATASKRPNISPLQPATHPFLPVDERRNINRSLKHCGFSSSHSTPAFPLSPTSPTSPGAKTVKLPELTEPPMSPPATPLALLDAAPLTPTTLSDCHFAAAPASSPDLPARRQPLRSHADEFTPSWVRGQGTEKEGHCAKCSEKDGNGKWFRLKDGSYWYHLQFVHGVSSISGSPFRGPTETRCVTNDQGVSSLEGFCGTCSSWNTFETYRPTPTSTNPPRALAASRNQWYRHAHTCHVQVPLVRSTRLAPPLQTAQASLCAKTPPFVSLPLVSAA